MFFNSMSKKAKELAARYGKQLSIGADQAAKQVLDELYCVAAYTHPKFPIITAANEIEFYSWGLIPRFMSPKKNTPDAKDKVMEKAKKISNQTINARAETIFEKVSYKGSIHERRCLIPSTGFFEFHTKFDGTKQPYFIFLEDQEIFSIAGIWDEWFNPDTGKEERTFSMITTEANELMYWVHNGGNNPHRMPVIIAKEDEEKWLNPDLTEAEIKELMKPFNPNRMNAFPVKKDFRDKTHRNPRDPTIWDEDLDAVE